MPKFHLFHGDFNEITAMIACNSNEIKLKSDKTTFLTETLMRLSLLAIAILSLTAMPQHVMSERLLSLPIEEYQLAQSYSCGRTCGQVSSCREAVYQWCVCNYRRADGDNDGVPCESVCGQSTQRNIDRVRSFKQELGCR